MLRLTNRWWLPLVLPFSQKACRERDQYVMFPVRSVRSNASRFIHAIIRTSPLTWSCAITGTNPAPSNPTSASSMRMVVLFNFVVLH